MDDEPQDALFDIEGPDEDECVWITFNDGEVRNMGPRAAVAEKLSAWLGAIDFGE